MRHIQWLHVSVKHLQTADDLTYGSQLVCMFHMSLQ
jgi:hypothetical protein